MLSVQNDWSKRITIRITKTERVSFALKKIMKCKWLLKKTIGGNEFGVGHQFYKRLKNSTVWAYNTQESGGDAFWRGNLRRRGFVKNLERDGWIN